MKLHLEPSAVVSFVEEEVRAAMLGAVSQQAVEEKAIAWLDEEIRFHGPIELFLEPVSDALIRLLVKAVVGEVWKRLSGPGAAPGVPDPAPDEFVSPPKPDVEV